MNGSKLALLAVSAAALCSAQTTGSYSFVLREANNATVLEGKSGRALPFSVKDVDLERELNLMSAAGPLRVDLRASISAAVSPGGGSNGLEILGHVGDAPLEFYASVSSAGFGMDAGLRVPVGPLAKHLVSLAGEEQSRPLRLRARRCRTADDEPALFVFAFEATVPAGTPIYHREGPGRYATRERSGDGASGWVDYLPRLEVQLPGGESDRLYPASNFTAVGDVSLSVRWGDLVVVVQPRDAGANAGAGAPRTGLGDRLPGN